MHGPAPVIARRLHATRWRIGRRMQDSVGRHQEARRCRCAGDLRQRFKAAVAAVGGLSGDALSVARWGYDLYGADLLGPESVTQMTDFKDGDGYGLGTFDYTNDHWYTSHVDGFGHHGVIPGCRTVLAVYPDMSLSIAILTPSNVEPLPYVRYLERAVAPASK